MHEIMFYIGYENFLRGNVFTVDHLHTKPVDNQKFLIGKQLFKVTLVDDSLGINSVILDPHYQNN